MHALLIHQAFVSPNEAGGTRHFEFARYCVQQGHQFTIVASDLSYLSGARTVESAGWVTEQQIEAVRVLRAYTFPALHRSFAWRIVSFLSFMVSSVVAALRARDVDVVIGTSPPIFQALSAWLVAALRRRPFLLEIRDLWPEFAIALGVLRNPLLIRMARGVERFLYRHATHLLVNSPAYRDYLIAQGVPVGRITLISNGVDPDMFDPSATGAAIREQYGLKDKFVVTYAGALGLANDIGTIVGAAGHLRAHPRVHFLLVGDGKERKAIVQRIAREQLANITLTGARPKSEMAALLAASDVCVATLQNIPMFRTTYPNKVFDYMAAGRPTILAIDGVIRAVIEAAEGGLFVPPGDAAALAAAIAALTDQPERVRQMGTRARQYVVAHFNRKDQAYGFVRLLQTLTPQTGKMGLYQSRGKPLLDRSLAGAALLVFAPALVALALAVRLRLGSPILFRQERPGLHGKPFMLLKFRTMTDAHDGAGTLLPDAQRLSPFGRWLRSTSLDELPELINVLRGEMSLVGPRPLLMRYLPHYTPEQARRHALRPGITGWAQVSGRNALGWEERFRLDVWYVDHHSLGLDLRILLLTLWRVLRREGISQEGEATMSEFQGSPQE